VVLSQLAPAIDGVRLSLHVIAAAVWVGGQLTVAGLLPTVRRLGDDAARRIARAFAQLSWPAYAVLVATGIWNVLMTRRGQPTAWQVVLAAKLAVVIAAGLAAWLHPRAKSRMWLGIWGGVAGLFSVAALVMGVFLAG
jgi:putative copper export protein